MPGRSSPLITGEIYHVFNRGIDKRPTFTSEEEFERAVKTLLFYPFAIPSLRLSWFIKLSAENQIKKLNTLRMKPPKVSILCYCCMSNHFHLLLRQETDGGISKFLSDFQNSYTRYYNTLHERSGPLFMGQFKAVRIESEGQLLHVSRYIHLNPYVSRLLNSLDELRKYPWSSLRDYLGKGGGILDREPILGSFSTKNGYKEFVFNQADYQRKFKQIEHLAIE